MMGTAIGAVFNYIMMNNIIDNQFDTLISIEGTNVWSGQQAQAFNSLSVTWGGLSHQLFSVGGTYQWMTLIFIPGFFVPIPFWLLHKKYPRLGLNNINTAVIILYISWLCVGINSSLMAFFFFGLISQAYIRKRYPELFVKYNYLVSAALDGGTSIIVFILSFAVAGASGTQHNFRESSSLISSTSRVILDADFYQQQITGEITRAGTMIAVYILVLRLSYSSTARLEQSPLLPGRKMYPSLNHRKFDMLK